MERAYFPLSAVYGDPAACVFCTMSDTASVDDVFAAVVVPLRAMDEFDAFAPIEFVVVPVVASVVPSVDDSVLFTCTGALNVADPPNVFEPPDWLIAPVTPTAPLRLMFVAVA